jgi:hypothetical protein
MKGFTFNVPWVFLLTLCVLPLTGCFVTEFTLIDPKSATVTRTFVGDWVFPGDDGFTLTVRNFDGKSYVVRMEPTKESDKPQAGLYRAFTTEVEDVTFAHLQPLKADGTLDGKWIIMRVAVTDGNELVLRHLSEAFFDEHPITSSDSLRKTIAEYVDDDAMYDTTVLTGRRMK